MRIACFVFISLFALASAAALAKRPVKAKGKGKQKAASSKAGGFGASKGGFGATPKQPTTELFQTGAWRQAVAAKSNELVGSPADARHWIELGSLMVKGREYAEAERIFRAGAAWHPSVETLSAAALTLGGDSGAYWHGESVARSLKAQPPSPEEPLLSFESFEAPPLALATWDQADRAIEWAEDSVAAKHGAVHRSSSPLIDPADCAWAIEATEAFAAANGGWTTARHVQAPTTDVPVSQVPALREWFDDALRTTLFPMLAQRYPHVTGGACNLRVMDAFVVRYDAAAQRSLPVHQDENILSFTIALNDRDEYEGGGVIFEALRPIDAPPGSPFAPTVLNADAGGVVTFPGKLRHGGNAITSGRRYIVPLFIYVDANRSGKKPGYLLSSLGLPEPPNGDGGAALSRYASSVAVG